MQNSSDTISDPAGEPLSQPKTPGELPALLARIQAQADNAYIAYSSLCRKDAALGWEIKAERGCFGLAELSAHKAAAEMLGKHRALYEVSNMLHELIQKGK